MRKAVILLVGRERWDWEVGVRALTGKESPRIKQGLEVRRLFRLPTCAGREDTEGGGGVPHPAAFMLGKEPERVIPGLCRRMS